MDNDIDIDRFVKDPSLLIELCHKVVNLVDGGTQIEEVATKEAQLREIAKTVERLDSIGVAVPDSLRAEKTKLAAELGTKKDSLLALNVINEGLEKVLRDLRSRLLRVPKRTGLTKLKKRIKSGDGFQTPQSEIKDCLIDSLRQLGGYAHCNEVLDVMTQKLKGKFLPGDLESDKSHGMKWRHNAHWARLDLANDGILVKDSPRGYWQLSKGQR